MADRFSFQNALRAPNSAAAGSAGHGQGVEKRAASGHLKSRVIKRSIVVAGHKTSVSLEDVFWNALRDIAHHRHIHLSQLVGNIDSERQHGNLSSAIRLFVFEQSRNNSGDGHPPEGDGRDTPESRIPRRP
jgi:predicted DNA-binding ribbon-helix-helix protein